MAIDRKEMTLDEIHAQECLNNAPLYQAVPIPKHSTSEFKRFLRVRNEKCKRLSTDRLMILPDLLGKRVLDIGCNTGFFGFASRPHSYLGYDTDERAIDAAIALRVTTARKRLGFYHCDENVIYDLSLKGPKFDIILFLSIYHHMIGNIGYDEGSRRQLQLLSQMAPVMYFDMGQKDEPTNADRDVWWSKLPNIDPLEFIPKEVLSYSEYTAYEQIEFSTVAGHKGRMLFRFSRGA